MPKETQLALGRLVGLIVVFVNQYLASKGMSVLPFDSAQVEFAVATVITVVVSIFTWWKNNNVTKPAVEAQKVLDRLKKPEKEVE